MKEPKNHETIALVRPPGESFAKALSQNPGNIAIDISLAQRQHRNYVKALEQAGATVVLLDALEDFPDSVFVEDTAIILKDRAIICPMKEDTRRGETESIKSEINNYRELKVLRPPVSLDGGDAINTGEALFIGLSKRTNKEAVSALTKLTDQQIIPAPVINGLHLKSSATYIGENTIVINPARIDRSTFAGYELIEVKEEESYAANCLPIGKNVLIADGYPKLAKQISERGFIPHPIPMTEFAKAEGALTCLSLIF